jgi:hypothetical protein
VAKRSYGTGRLYVVVDRGGRVSWYGSWWVGRTRVNRKINLKRTPGNADGLTRTQAERALRCLVDATNVVAKGQRRTVGEAGDAYLAHLEKVMERKRTTIADGSSSASSSVRTGAATRSSSSRIQRPATSSTGRRCASASVPF